MLLKFGAVLSIIFGFLMARYTWIHLLQRIVVVRSFLRMVKIRKLAVRKLYVSRGVRTRRQGVSDHGLNLHQNIPLRVNCPDNLLGNGSQPTIVNVKLVQYLRPKIFMYRKADDSCHYSVKCDVKHNVANQLTEEHGSGRK